MLPSCTGNNCVKSYGCPYEIESLVKFASVYPMMYFDPSNPGVLFYGRLANSIKNMKIVSSFLYIKNIVNSFPKHIFVLNMDY